MSFWNLFSRDHRTNCRAWRHSDRNPAIPATGETWKKFWTANPDVLEFAGKRLLYYRGNGFVAEGDGTRHDRIGVAEILSLGTDAIEIQDLNHGLPIVDIGEPGAFDARHVLDPATIVFRGEVWLYYSAIGDGADSVGLARSSDGIHFEKVGKVLEGRAPDVVARDDGIAMLYQIPTADGHHEFFLAHSRDGIRFQPRAGAPVFSRGACGWDSRDVVTGRLLCEGDEFYLLYGGSSSLIDQPDAFGLARSQDLIHWERHPGNPVFGCGPKGTEDGGAIWFPALIEMEEAFVLLYEGSRGNYQGDLSSQICMASIPRIHSAEAAGGHDRTRRGGTAVERSAGAVFPL